MSGSIRRVKNHRCRRRGSSERSAIPRVSPQAPGDDFASGDWASSCHRRAVVPLPTRVTESARLVARATGCTRRPSRQRRRVEINAFTRVIVALPVQRLMLGELRLRHHRLQVRAGAATRDRMERGRRPRDGLTGALGDFRPRRLDHFPLPRNSVPGLGDALAEFGDFALSAGTGGPSGNDQALTRQKIGPRTGIARANVRTVVASIVTTVAFSLVAAS
jgi:hypothetical protein